MNDDTESELTSLAAYHLGVFVGTASRDYDRAAVAHGLFLLAQLAEQWRQRITQQVTADDA